MHYHDSTRFTLVSQPFGQRPWLETVCLPAGFHSASVVLAGSLIPATVVSVLQTLNVPKPGELYLSVSLITMLR